MSPSYPLSSLATCHFFQQYIPTGTQCLQAKAGKLGRIVIILVPQLNKQVVKCQDVLISTALLHPSFK